MPYLSETLLTCCELAWGMSELSPVGTCNSDADTKPSSIGPLIPSTYGKIIDEAGNSVGPNESGELCIKGPQVMMVRSHSSNT